MKKDLTCDEPRLFLYFLYLKKREEI